jgi:hypothetical protein
MYDEKLMPRDTDKLVVALCADYFRRKRMIDRRLAPYNVIMECRYLNYRILDAACSIVGVENAEKIIREIGERKGYADSKVEGMSELTYKRKKKEVKRAIARRLSLF